MVNDGADINRTIVWMDGERTPMHIAAWNPSADILKYLIEQGGKINAKDQDGKTPYDYAKMYDFKDNMELLQ